MEDLKELFNNVVKDGVDERQMAKLNKYLDKNLESNNVYSKEFNFNGDRFIMDRSANSSDWKFYLNGQEIDKNKAAQFFDNFTKEATKEDGERKTYLCSIVERMDEKGVNHYKNDVTVEDGDNRHRAEFEIKKEENGYNFYLDGKPIGIKEAAAVMTPWNRMNMPLQEIGQDREDKDMDKSFGKDENVLGERREEQKLDFGKALENIVKSIKEIPGKLFDNKETEHLETAEYCEQHSDDIGSSIANQAENDISTVAKAIDKAFNQNREQGR